MNDGTPRRIGALALGAGCLAIASAAAAQAPASTIDSVVVTASRNQSRVDEMPLHTTVVTREEIERSPAQTLDQLLRNVPGLNFTGIPATQSDPTCHQTRMRGLGNAKVLVLLDGVPIHDPFYLTTQWYRLPLSNIERVEVIRGGNSSLWGNMAVAGVINIVSRRVKGDDGELAASVGSRDSYSAALTKSFKLGDAFGLNFALDQMKAGGYQTTPSEYLWRFPGKDVPDARNSNFQATLYANPSSATDAYLRVGYHVQDQDINYTYGNNKQESPDFSASLTHRLDGASSVQASAWAQYVRFEKYNGSACYFQPSGTRCPNANQVTPAQVNDNILQYYTQYGSQRYREQGASGIWSTFLGGWLRGVQAGADYRHLAATDLEFFYGAPTSQAAPQGNLGSSTYGEADQTFAAVFAQARFVPAEGLEVTASGRYDTWKNENRLNTRTTAAGATTGGPIEDSTKSAFDPSLAVRYEAAPGVALRAAAYKSFRAPGFNNTTRTFGATTPTIANPFLEPENLKGYEGGVDYASGPFRASATAYRYDISNMIATFRVNNYATAPDLVRQICSNGGPNLANCGGSANYYTNDQDGRSQGVELTGRWEAGPSLAVEAWYTYTRSELTRRGDVVTDPVGVQLVAIPKHVALLGVTGRPVPALRLYAEARYVGPMPIDTTSVPGTVFEQGGATVWNASASYALDRRIDLFASVVNLFDKGYSEGGYTYNQPYNRTLSQPRTVNAGVKVRFP